jgi:hypothetical protein
VLAEFARKLRLPSVVPPPVRSFCVVVDAGHRIGVAASGGEFNGGVRRSQRDDLCDGNVGSETST